MAKKKKNEAKVKICLRCRKELPFSKFTSEEGSNYYVHNVCNECREFMRKRTDYLIKADKKFHAATMMDYDITHHYRNLLVTNGISSERLFS